MDAARGKTDAEKARVKDPAAPWDATKPSQETCLAELNEDFAQEGDHQRRQPAFETVLQRLAKKAVAFCEQTGAERNETTCRSRHTLMSIGQIEVAQEDEDDDASYKIAKLRRLYEEGRCIIAFAFAASASKWERSVL